MTTRRKCIVFGAGAALALGIFWGVYMSMEKVVELPEGGSIRIYRMSFTGNLSFEYPGKVGMLLVKKIPSLETFASFTPANATFGSADPFVVCFLKKPPRIAAQNGGHPPSDSPYRLDVEGASQSFRDSRGLYFMSIPGVDLPDKTNVRFQSSGLVAAIPMHSAYGPYFKLHIRRRNDPTNGPTLATFHVRNELFGKGE